MDVGSVNQAIGGLAVRNANISLLAQLLHQQQVAGVAMVEMIAGSGGHAAPRSTAPSPAPADGGAPPKGAAEPGKGQNVDIVV
ncbi:MAG: hypothetical protein NXI31_16510 [bacterium]|nr:hypothetical protein [bacterium]